MAIWIPVDTLARVFGILSVIGAHEEVDMSMFDGENLNFRTRYEDGFWKYTLGAFRDVERAEAFMESLRQIGFGQCMAACHERRGAADHRGINGRLTVRHKAVITVCILLF